MKVAIVMGSTSDLGKVEPAVNILKEYGVEVNVRCLSAHRAHVGLSAFIKETETDGTEVIIAAAGMAAALPGVIASQTVLPVIGVPIVGNRETIIENVKKYKVDEIFVALPSIDDKEVSKILNICKEIYFFISSAISSISPACSTVFSVIIVPEINLAISFFLEVLSNFSIEVYVLSFSTFFSI